MESSVGQLVNTTLNVIDRLEALRKKYAKLPESVTSIRRDLRYIEGAIRERSCTADQHGIRIWLNDLRWIKTMIVNAVEYYDLEIRSHTRTCSGIGACVWYKCAMMLGPEKDLLDSLNDIKKLLTDVRKRFDSYRLQDLVITSGDDEDYHHPKEADPVGVEAVTSQIARMLSDTNLLRVVAISGPDPSRNSCLAEAAYNQVRVDEDQNFQCQAWVTASQSRDAQNILLDILHQLGATHQGSPNLIELARILRDLLTNKRYIIGICGLETTDCWDDVICAFPDDKTSSRIIVTTIKEQIAQACRKNSMVSSLEATKEDIVQILSRDKAAVTGRKVIAILGPPACGKTTVAEAAYTKVKEEEKFECRVWSRATQSCKTLLRDILDQLGTPQPESKTTLDLVEILEHLLTGKRYIIGIDGLETEEYWRDVAYACPENNNGSRIIVTTGSKNTARKCDNIYQLRKLDESSAQDLLVRELFGKDGCDNNLCEYLNIILETCEYHPLAILNIGDHMKGLNKNWNYEDCAKLCSSFSSLLVNKEYKSFRGMRYVLDRSYKSLTPNAQAFLRSLSSYPIDFHIKHYDIEDQELEVKPLVSRLVVEKLVPAANECDLINECITPLIEHNFIVPTNKYINGDVRTFRVKRMLAQFIKEKSYQENYVTRIDIEKGLDVGSQADTISRLYLCNTSSSKSPGIRGDIDLTQTQLLTFHGEANRALMDFNDCKFLRVLILEKCKSIEVDDLYSVCKLKMLKYLSIRGNKNLKLPKNIKNMLNLETLDARGTMVHTLPMSVILLPQLAHLFGKFKIIVEKSELCSSSFLGSVNSCQLQTLAGFLVDESPLFITLLHCMPKLSKVKILHSKVAHGGNSSQTMIALNEKVQKDLIKSLNICFSSSSSSTAHNSGTRRLRSLSFDFSGCDLDFLNHLEVPYFLPSLKVHGKLTILPKWITSQYNLQELRLSGSNIEHLSELQGQEKLVFLKITGDFNKYCSKFAKDFIWHSGWFKSLKRLHLNLPYLPKIVIQKGAMPNLQFLQLSCTDFGGFDGIENLVQLEELMLPSADISSEAINLMNQVKRLPTRPMVSRSGPGRRKLAPSKQFQKSRLKR